MELCRNKESKANYRMWIRALVSRTHARQKFRGRIGIGGQAVFLLHLLDRLPGFQAGEAVDLADIVTGARQHGLHLLHVGSPPPALAFADMKEMQTMLTRD